MNDAIGGAANAYGYGVLSTLIANSTATHNRLDTLTAQASSGLVAQTYSGLAEGGRISLSLRPEIARHSAWQSAISVATTQMTETQSVLTQVESIASNLNEQLNTLNGLDASQVDAVAANARSSLQQLAGLLDTEVGGTYIFSGNDSGNPPVPNPDSILSTGFATQIATAVGNLSTAGAAATASATLAASSSNAAGVSPFTAALSQPASTINATLPSVEVGPGQRVTFGIAASANGTVMSAGSSTTGSYMRDLMRALATVGSLTSAQVSDPNFQALISDTRTSLRGAISAMTTEAGNLGQTQQSLTATATRLGDTAATLTTQVSNVEDVDMAKTLSALSQTQTQLQASYQMIAAENNLSLVKFLPVG